MIYTDGQRSFCFLYEIFIDMEQSRAAYKGNNKHMFGKVETNGYIFNNNKYQIPTVMQFTDC